MSGKATGFTGSDILDSRGVPTTFMSSKLAPPPGSSPFFGWVDRVGDPCSVRIASVTAVCRNGRSQKFVLILENTPSVLELDDVDAMRLLKRMGWTVPD